MAGLGCGGIGTNRDEVAVEGGPLRWPGASRSPSSSLPLGRGAGSWFIFTGGGPLEVSTAVRKGWLEGAGACLTCLLDLKMLPSFVMNPGARGYYKQDNSNDWGALKL